MDLLNNITNCVANVIARVRQAVLSIPSFVGLHMRLEARGEEWFYGLTTLNKPKSREVSTNDGIITQNIFNAAVPTSIETK